MRDVRIGTIDELLRVPLWDTHTMLFRGIADAAHKLLPSIGRVAGKDEASRAKYERRLLQEFERRALPFLNNIPKTSLEWLFLAQHYGIPTRLLDWTTNPMVALYFACEKHLRKDGAVYQYVHSKWIDGALPVTDPFELSEIVGLRPKHSDVRYVNQDGAFTIHPQPTIPFDNDGITKYVVPAAAKDRIQWQLRKLGFRASFIYPSLEGLSKDIAAELQTTLRGGTLRTTNVLR